MAKRKYKSNSKKTSKAKRILAGVLGTVIVGSAGIGIGCAVNKDFRNNIVNFKNGFVDFFKGKKSLRAEIDELLEKIESLEQESESKINNYKLQIENLTTEKTTLQTEKSNLQKQLEEKEARIKELEAQGILDSAEVQRLNAEIQAINNRITELESRVTVLENQEIILRNTISELEKSLSDLNVQVNNLWNIFENYQNYVESDGTTVEELTEEEIQIVEDRIDELEQEIEEKTSEVQEIENQKIIINVELQELISQKPTYESQIDDLNSNIINTEKSINSLANANTGHQKNIDSNNKTIENLQSLGDKITDEEQNQLDNLINQNQTLQNKIDKNKTTINGYQKQLEEFQIQLNNYNLELDRIESRIEVLETNYSALDLQAQSLNQNINNLQTQLNSFNKFLNKATGKEETPTYGESIFKLPLEEFKTSEDVKSYLKNNKITYQEVEVTDEQTAVFPGATVIYSMVLDQTTQGMIIVYSDESSASAIFDSIESNRENIENSGQVTIQYVNASGNIGVVELVYKGSIGGGDEEHTHTISYYNTEEIMSETGVLETVKIGYCDCGKELSRETIIVEHTHTAGESVRENEYQDGHKLYYDRVQYCKDCGEELSRKQVSEHICYVEYYNHENEVTLDDGSRQYDNVGYCECGKELSRETIVEKQAELISFNIANYNGFTAEKGMTFEQWFNSEYNTSYLEIHNEKYLVVDSCYGVVIDSSTGSPILLTDIISEDSYYMLQFSVELISDEAHAEMGLMKFNIQGLSSTLLAETGMNWKDFINSSYNRFGLTYTDEGNVKHMSADGIELILQSTEGRNILYGETITKDITYQLVSLEAEAKTVFTIDGVEYKFEDGMTWNDYAVNPEYNSMGLYVSDSNNLVYLNGRILTSEGKTVYGTDLIQSTTYKFVS